VLPNKLFHLPHGDFVNPGHGERPKLCRESEKIARGAPILSWGTQKIAWEIEKFCRESEIIMGKHRIFHSKAIKCAASTESFTARPNIAQQALKLTQDG